MPKTPKKSAKAVTKKPAAKAKKAAAPKLKVKASMKPKAESKGSRRGFMWKVLEQKQQKQKEHGNSALLSANPEDRAQAPNHNAHGFGRFHGPRRRVG